MYVGLMGFAFLAGIVVGCLTIARLGDIYGRRPIYMLGLYMQLAFTITVSVLKTRNLFIVYPILLLFGMSITARAYVGYSFNIEM